MYVCMCGSMACDGGAWLSVFVCVYLPVSVCAVLLLWVCRVGLRVCVFFRAVTVNESLCLFARSVIGEEVCCREF